MKILLAEDDVVLHQLYEDLLKEAGYEVTGVIDGTQALAQMMQGGFDLVLLDQMMPGLTGMEVMEKMKAEKSVQPNKKIVFMTNVDNPKQLEAMNQMSNGYLLKGNLTPDQFLEKVKAYLI